MHNGASHAVGIGIGRDEQVWMHTPAQIQAPFESFAKLWIGIGASGEIAIGHRLLRYDRNVPDANFVQDAGNARKTGAVKRRVDDA